MLLFFDDQEMIMRFGWTGCDPDEQKLGIGYQGSEVWLVKNMFEIQC